MMRGRSDDGSYTQHVGDIQPTSQHQVSSLFSPQAVEELLLELDLDKKSIVLGGSRVRTTVLTGARLTLNSAVH